MLRLDNDTDAYWLEDRFNSIGDLHSKAFLNLQALGKRLDDTRQLADPYDAMLGKR